jgi:DNA primase
MTASLSTDVYTKHLKLERRGQLLVASCPFHTENSPSFTIYPDGHFHCFGSGCGAHGDEIEFLRRIEGLSFADASARTGNGSRYERRPDRRPRGTGNYAARLVAQGSPIAGTLAERYLREVRGLGELPLPAEPRFHPGVWSRETSSQHPALIIPCRDADDNVARIQAVLLDPATGGKASVQSPKLTFGAGASHLPANLAARALDDMVLLCEGPEDGIVLWSITGLRTLIAFGNGSLHKPILPASTKLVIVSDNTEEGREAAYKAAVAHAARGCVVRIASPGEGLEDAH